MRFSFAAGILLPAAALGAVVDGKVKSIHIPSVVEEQDFLTREETQRLLMPLAFVLFLAIASVSFAKKSRSEVAGTAPEKKAGSCGCKIVSAFQAMRRADILTLAVACMLMMVAPKMVLPVTIAVLALRVVYAEYQSDGRGCQCCKKKEEVKTACASSCCSKPKQDIKTTKCCNGACNCCDEEACCKTPTAADCSCCCCDSGDCKCCKGALNCCDSGCCCCGDDCKCCSKGASKVPGKAVKCCDSGCCCDSGDCKCCKGALNCCVSGCCCCGDDCKCCKGASNVPSKAVKCCDSGCCCCGDDCKCCSKDASKVSGKAM
ncbi:MAG: hypothetical protein SGBAC_011779, partial [Bacillariaceae sp.]